MEPSCRTEWARGVRDRYHDELDLQLNFRHHFEHFFFFQLSHRRILFKSSCPLQNLSLDNLRYLGARIHHWMQCSADNAFEAKTDTAKPGKHGRRCEETGHPFAWRVKKL